MNYMTLQFCEECERETPHSTEGEVDAGGVMRQWLVCEVCDRRREENDAIADFVKRIVADR